jgi:uncharacterized protein YjbI with pentapeptide repeats
LGIQIGKGQLRRDWRKVTLAAVECAVQAIALGKDGFSAAITAFFRTLDELRGNDDVPLRATRLVIETLGYALSATIASSNLGRKPQKPEAQEIINSLIGRADNLAGQNTILLESAHLEHPAAFSLFEDAAAHIFHRLRFCEPKESEANIVARFRGFVSEGFNRIRIRDPNYFSPVLTVLSGPDARADARVRAWDEYRALLIRRFEDEPLFGEEAQTGVTTGQAYQPLRAWWDDIAEEIMLEPLGDGTQTAKLQPPKKLRRHLEMLDELVQNWLNLDDKLDRVRLVSGGPGSGKSTFAKRLASVLAREPRWRVVFVPLQRLRGTGPLETRIDEYFLLQGNEPFEADSLPLTSIGRDGHYDWLVIFDGLDELAKEGASSESAAQDFASALADWRGRIGNIGMRFLVLGRAPSMQEAQRRLGLRGAGTFFVADMAPLTGQAENIIFDDPHHIRQIDQRSEYWTRWATAKGLPINPPEAMTVEALSDLTKEPLLAYLLILSGYADERWEEAAENRNRIYRAIFDQIWNRERAKPTRSRLNDLGKLGFESLMQALGLAAWRGGGRTGDESTFNSMRDIFMRPDLLAKAKACGAAELGNVALLFYTRRDEREGRGYEFLHKSFGEYLTARGLLSAFLRWGEQVDDPTRDFDSTEFLRRWLKLAGASPMTWEILNFLRNEVRLQAASIDELPSWQLARDWVRIGERIVDKACRDGLPAHEGASTWREAEFQQRNGEQALLAMLDACARAAYPSILHGAAVEQGGWESGPVRISVFQEHSNAFWKLLLRLRTPDYQGLMYASRVVGMSNGIEGRIVSRFSLPDVNLFGETLAFMDLEGADMRNAKLHGAAIIRSDLSYANLTSAYLSFAHLETNKVTDTDFRGADFTGAEFFEQDMTSAKLDKNFRKEKPIKERARLATNRRKRSA